MAHRPLPVKELVPVVAKELTRLGFRPVHKSKTGSRYLVWPGTPWQIRISDHAWSMFNRDRQAQVVKVISLQSLEPVYGKETYLLALEFAIAFIVRTRLRQGIIGTLPAGAGEVDRDAL